MNIDLVLDAQNHSERVLLLVQGEGNLTLESEGGWLCGMLRSPGIVQVASVEKWNFFKL